MRAHRLTVRFGPAELAERGFDLLISHGEDICEMQRLGLFAEEEVLGHDISVIKLTDMYAIQSGIARGQDNKYVRLTTHWLGA